MVNLNATVKWTEFEKTIQQQGGIDASDANLAAMNLAPQQRAELKKLRGADGLIPASKAREVWDRVVDKFDGLTNDVAEPNRETKLPPGTPAFLQHVLTLMKPDKPTGVSTRGQQPEQPARTTGSARRTRTL